MNRFLYAFLVVLTTFIMGSAFSIGRIGMDYSPPFFLMGLRFVLAGLLMAAITFKRPKPRTWREWGQIALIGILNSAGVMGCSYYSMRWITSGESAILIFVNPLLVIILGTLWLGTRYRIRQWAGVVVGLAGVVCTFGIQFHLQPGTFISLLGAFFFATATFLTKRWGGSFDTWVLSGYQILAGGFVLLLLSAMTENPYFVVTGYSVFSLGWLVLINSIVQFTLWSYLLKKGDPARTSAFLFLAPLFGVLGGWALLGEPLHWYLGAGGLLIAAGIFLSIGKPAASTNRRKPPQGLQIYDILEGRF